KIIEWASPLNFFLRQADIFSNRQPGTGEWLLQSGVFNKWKTGEIQVLWLSGAGKTVLASIVVDDLRRNSANGVGVLYLDHKATAEAHSPRNLLSTIWRQLALEEFVPSDFHALYKIHHRLGTRLSVEETYSILRFAISRFSDVFIVVDALDDYPEGDRNALLRNLWELGAPVRLLLTSRPHIHIDHIISNIKTVDVRATEEDIRKYVMGQIAKSPRLLRHINKSSTLWQSLEEKIVGRPSSPHSLHRPDVLSIEPCSDQPISPRPKRNHLDVHHLYVPDLQAGSGLGCVQGLKLMAIHRTTWHLTV
ncbi:hypothetical protein DFH07DRAFT_731790, partial [Mycena maculata]